MSGIFQINLNGIIVEVDAETARMLQEDAVFRENYEKAVQAHLNSEHINKQVVQQTEQNETEILLVESSNESSVQIGGLESEGVDRSSVFTLNENAAGDQMRNQNSEIVWTSKHTNPRDLEATHVLLELRKQLAPEFDDQKHSKTSLWQRIAKQLNEKNFFVGQGLEGAEKCRKKFANLQAAYIKYKDKKRQTGEGNIAKPPYFDLIDEILGTKDKVTPKIIIDSINFSDIQIPENLIKENETDMSSASSQPLKSKEPTAPQLPRDKFQNIKSSVRPAKNEAINNLIDLHKKDMEERRREFNRIMEFLETNSQQRHEQVMAFLKSKEKSKKRKRKQSEGSSDSDD